MKTGILLLVLLFAAVIYAVPYENLPKSEVLEIDRAELRFIVKLSSTNLTRVIQITSETRFLKDGKYAISEDLDAGDTVTGTIHKRADGVYEAVRITIKKAPQAVGAVGGPVERSQISKT